MATVNPEIYDDLLKDDGPAAILFTRKLLPVEGKGEPAKVTFEDVWVGWLPLIAVTISGGLMIFLDCLAIFRMEHFDRAAVERDLDKAESWLKSWQAPAVRIVTFGFVNPRKIVGAKVEEALVDANWLLIGGMWRLSLQIGMQLVLGLSLWLTWAFA